MNSKGAALAWGGVRRGLMERLAVMDRDPARRQINHHLLALIDLPTAIKQGVGRLRLIMAHWAQMRTRDELHGAIVLIDIIQSEPGADEVGRSALPIGVVLMPENRTTMVRWFVQCLVVE